MPLRAVRHRSQPCLAQGKADGGVSVVRRAVRTEKAQEEKCEDRIGSRSRSVEGLDYGVAGPSRSSESVAVTHTVTSCSDWFGKETVMT